MFLSLNIQESHFINRIGQLDTLFINLLMQTDLQFALYLFIYNFKFQFKKKEINDNIDVMTTNFKSNETYDIRYLALLLCTFTGNKTHLNN